MHALPLSIACLLACTACTVEPVPVPERPAIEPDAVAAPQVREGWFGYPFEIDRVDSIPAGATLDQSRHLLVGEPVARDVNADGTCCYIWYYERREELRAVELVFRDGRFERVGERVRMLQGAVDYSAIPSRLDAANWITFSEWGRADEDALFLEPKGPVSAGFAYDVRAEADLVPGKTSLGDAQRILGGSPAWIAEFSDGTVRAEWFQLTATRGTSIQLAFDSEGWLVSTPSRAFQTTSPPGPPELGSTNPAGAELTRLVELWKPER